MKSPMLTRFCLYGFLKNQRYFEPFLILAFRQKGLSFATIGTLVAFREICVNLMEIPTGAVADVLGRRRAMIASFAAYSAAFAVFALADGLGMLAAAMFCFAIGEAFRTGTHKAMIFTWLARQGREQEKTAVYGLTRSWSKLGSALSMPIAAAIAFCFGTGPAIFLASIVPCLANIVNFLTYPRYLDGEPAHKSLLAIASTLWSALQRSVRLRPLRRLLTESMGYEGIFKACMDYLQPILKTAALGMPVLLALNEHQRTAILVGVVYFALHLLSSLASRRAGRFAKAVGGDEQAAHRLWQLDLLAFALLAVGIALELSAVMILAFVVLAVLQNFWRPVLVARCADLAEPGQMATVLSIESQAKSLFVAVTAPLLGWSIDAMAGVSTQWRFLPLALLGMLVPALMLVSRQRDRERSVE